MHLCVWELLASDFDATRLDAIRYAEVSPLKANLTSPDESGNCEWKNYCKISARKSRSDTVLYCNNLSKPIIKIWLETKLVSYPVHST